MAVHETARGFVVDRRDAYGKRLRLTTATRPAAEALDARLEEEARHQRRALQHFRQSANLTLAEAVTEYLRARVVSPLTRQSEIQKLTALGKKLGHLNLADVTPTLVAQYFEARKLVLAPSSLYRETRIIHSVFRWFQEQWFIPANPVQALQVPPPRLSVARCLSARECEQILALATEHTRPKILLALDAGLTIGETVRLRRHDLDLAQRSLHVWPLKRRAERSIPMTERLWFALEALLAGVERPDALLFTRAMRSLRATASFMPTLRNRVQFHFRYHDLRHTFATRLAAVAQRPRLVQYLLGHHPTSPTDWYDHPQPEELRAAIQSMQAADSAAREKFTTQITDDKPSERS